MRRLLILGHFTTIIPLVSMSSPYVLKWSTTRFYGPDGPWPALTIQVGTDANGSWLNTVDLYPGGTWSHTILTKQICNDQKFCHATLAGLYDVNSSNSAINVTASPDAHPGYTESARNISASASLFVDSISLEGIKVIPNSTILAMEQWWIKFPCGSEYSSQVGNLALTPIGAQSFENVPGYGYVTGNSIFGPSNETLSAASFGLHYGSATLSQVGSLVFGGYDQSRILGHAAAYDFEGNQTTRTGAMTAGLLDIEIGIETGGTPLNSSTPYPGSASETNASYITGLLQQDASFYGSQPTTINPLLPYLFMSPGTCNKIARNLPLTLRSDIGLYTWDTENPAAAKIIQSPAYLAFVFALSGDGNITIKVPFALLSLTIESPIVPTPQQYFPCRPFYADDGSGYFQFGKAFLQAAFIGTNWEQNKWFMAQAPGPGVGASNIHTIGPNDVAINSDPSGNFGTTWAKHWTPISVPGGPSSGSTKFAFSSSDSYKSGISAAAKVGIGFGAGLAGFFLPCYDTNFTRIPRCKRRMLRLSFLKQA